MATSSWFTKTPAKTQTYAGGGLGGATKASGEKASTTQTARTQAETARATGNVAAVKAAETAMASKGASSYTPKLTPTGLAKTPSYGPQGGPSSFAGFTPADLKASQLYQMYGDKDDDKESQPYSTGPILTPDMTRQQQLEAMYKYTHGSPTDLTFNSASPDGSYIVVNQQNGTTSRMNANSIENYFLSKVKGAALNDFVQKGGTMTKSGDTPIAYTDSYGFEHYTKDPGNAAMAQMYANALKNAGVPYGSDHSPVAGRTYAMDKVPDGYEIRGGYMYGPNGQRVNMGLPDSVNYGNAQAAGGTEMLPGGANFSQLSPEQMRSMLTQSATDRFNGMNGQYANIANWENPYVDVRALAGQQNQQMDQGRYAGGPTQPVGFAPMTVPQGGATAPGGDIYQARLQNPDGSMGTGYIINGQTFYDPQGTQRVAPGTVVETRDGRTFTMKGEVASAYQPAQTQTTTTSDFASFLAEMGMGGGSGMAMPDAGQFKPTSFEEMLDQAGRSLSPMYDQEMAKALSAVDVDSAQRGFFGQTPWAGQRQETAAQVLALKSQAVSQLASQLYGMSANEAQAALQNAWNQYNAQQSNQSQMYNMWLNAMNQQKDDERYERDMALKTQQAQQEWQYDQDYLKYLQGNQQINQQKADYTTNKPYTTKTTNTTKKTTSNVGKTASAINDFFKLP